ncbi:MAG: AraC family transcriptional regulator [Planctomycetota bacterium]
MQPTLHTTVERIEAARRLIEARLDDEPSLDELAEAAALSPFHFHRLFRGLTGETVREFGRRLRLERAAHRLEHGEEDLLEIALAIGYSSHEAFARAFKKHFGASPSEYRGGTRAERAESPPREPGLAVRFEEREPCRVAYVRHEGPYSDVGEAWKALMKWGWTKLVFGSPTIFGLCFDDPDVTPAERLRYEACMVVGPRTKPRGPVQLRDLPGGPYAIATHRGDYASIGETYAELFASVDGSARYRLGDPPSLEVYVNDPRKTPPSKLITEVWMPVLPR